MICALVSMYKFKLHRKGGRAIERMKYYSQKDIITIISHDTGYSIRDVTKILGSLCNVIKNKFSDQEPLIEIKLFPGLKITARYIPLDQSKSNLSDYIKSDDTLFLSAKFSRRFKDSIKELHKKSHLKEIQTE